MIDKNTALVQVCADCGSKASFLEGIFYTCHMSDGTDRELFICEKCRPSNKKFEEIVKKVAK